MNKLLKCHIWSMAVYGAGTWILRKVDRKYLESSDMCSWRRKEKIRRTNHVRYKVVLHRVNAWKNVLHTIKTRETNLIGQILC